MKKLYETPQLQVYGNVEKITLGGTGGDADMFTGAPNPSPVDGDNDGCVKKISDTALDFSLCSVGMGEGSGSS